MNELIVYDFDKTIYDGDSTLDFYRFCIFQNPLLLRYLPIQSVALIQYIFKLKDKTYFKEKFFSFLKGIKHIENEVDSFWKKHQKKIKSFYMNKEQEHVVVISASPEFLLKSICQEIHVEKLIASRVDAKTGKFSSPNCYGEEKVSRLNEVYDNYCIKEFYSDSLSDISLKKLAKKSYLVKKEKIEEWN